MMAEVRRKKFKSFQLKAHSPAINPLWDLNPNRTEKPKKLFQRQLLEPKVFKNVF
jgi:hypothetical protein